MSKTISLKALIAWLESKKDKWSAEYFDLCTQYQEHVNFKRALETAYYLESLAIVSDPQIATIFFILDLPEEEQPEPLKKFISNLHMVRQLTVLSGEVNRSQEVLRKMFLALAEDVRVVVALLAYQIVVMRHARGLHEDDQRRIARNTNNIFAPIASRLGLSHVKWELEDYSLRFLEPQIYREIAGKLDSRRTEREEYIAFIVEKLENILKVQQIHGDVSGRVKHIYSIWRKMKQKNLAFGQVYDIRAVRILVNNVADCYAILGVVHEIWSPISKEFDDYIANPKPNGYQSLHTVVLTEEERTLEIQIRTFKMHENAELGVAAHWKYKEGGQAGTRIAQEDLNWLRELLNREMDDGLSEDSIFDDHVYVMTPAGEPVELLSGSTPLDFAYKIHTDLGHRCRGAMINGQIVPLTYVLKNGDKVEILAGKNIQPSRDWMSPHLEYIKSNRTRAKIRTWFKSQLIENNLQAGKHMLEKELSRLNINLNQEELKRLATKLHCTHVNELYANIGIGDITMNQLLLRLPVEKPKAEFDPELIVRQKSKEVDVQKAVHVRGIDNLLVNIASCCKPVPPDLIGGFITLNRGVSIHRLKCTNYQNMWDQKPERCIDVDWGIEQNQRVTVDVYICAFQNEELLKDISVLVSNEQLKIIDMSMSNEEDEMTSMKLTLEIIHLDQLSRLLDRLNQLPAVFEARRV